MSGIERKIVAVFQEGLAKSQGSYKDMVYGATTEDVQQGLQHMSKLCGVFNHRIPVTEKELKKAQPTYIKQW